MLEPNNSNSITKFMESFIAAYPENWLPYWVYGNYCYNIICDINKAKQVYLRGLEKGENNEKILISLLKVALFEEDKKEIASLKAQLKSLDINYLAHMNSYFPTNYVGPPVADQGYKSLSELIPQRHSTKPKIIDAEFHFFSKERAVKHPCIALFAYATPRPNLDVMYHLYKLLKSRGRNVLLFLRKSDMDKFDFSEINFTSDDVFYSTWNEFFNAADFIKCIISNDMCKLSHKNLADDCKLVFHAPHGAKLSAANPQNFISHYSTYVNGTPPNITSDLKNLSTPDRVCLIPNNYTKNEYLFDFVANFDSKIRAISYCPTIFTGINQQMHASGDYNAALEEYLGQIIGMIRGIINLLPEYYFIYRPFWGNSQHWVVTRRLQEEFGTNSRFLIDKLDNSKYALAISDIMITDYSGLAITFSEIKQVKHIRFQPFQTTSERLEGDENYYVICKTYDEVMRSVSDLSVDTMLVRFQRGFSRVMKFPEI